MAGASERSFTVQQLQVARWRREIKKLSPARRHDYLKTPEAIAALGARQCEQLRKSIAADFERMGRLVPSGAWLEAWWAHNERMPHFTPDAGRRHGVRMMLSRGMVRLGEDGIPHRRWTPPQAVEIEDLIDCQGDREAEMYPHPPSPSALAIFRWGTYTRAGLKRLARSGKW